MIFILFFLSAGFVFISHGLDKFSMPKHVSEKHFPTIQFIAKLFLSFALQLTILALVQFLVIETTQFNICAYLFSVKYIHLLLCGYGQPLIKRHQYPVCRLLQSPARCVFMALSCYRISPGQ